MAEGASWRGEGAESIAGCEREREMKEKKEREVRGK